MPSLDAKRVAALAGALLYMQELETARVRLTGEQAPRPGPTVPSPWALYGRQAIMAGRAALKRRRKP
jgi:hypothetical protein